VVTIWLRIARWTEDFTLLFEPGEMLFLLALHLDEQDITDIVRTLF
jgi:hypothetical protein